MNFVQISQEDVTYGGEKFLTLAHLMRAPAFPRSIDRSIDWSIEWMVGKKCRHIHQSVRERELSHTHIPHLSFMQHKSPKILCSPKVVVLASFDIKICFKDPNQYNPSHLQRISHKFIGGRDFMLGGWEIHSFFIIPSFLVRHTCHPKNSSMGLILYKMYQLVQEKWA